LILNDYLKSMWHDQGTQLDGWSPLFNASTPRNTPQNLTPQHLLLSYPVSAPRSTASPNCSNQIFRFNTLRCIKFALNFLHRNFMRPKRLISATISHVTLLISCIILLPERW
jgi:hypothetical protein